MGSADTGARIGAWLLGSQVGFVTFDAGGALDVVNEAAAAVLGQAVDALVGARLADLVHEDGAFERLQRAAAEEGRLIVTVDGADGAPRVVELAPSVAGGLLAAIVRDGALEARVAERTAALAREVEERRAAEERALAASRAKSSFLANMSHELRTPLNAIIGYAELLLEEIDDEASREDLRRVHGAARHLLALISDILDLSKIEAGRMDLFVEAVELAELLGEVEATGRPLAAAHRNRLVFDVDPAIEVLQTDGAKVKQILLNLVSNAAKFTQDGRITVEGRLEDGGRSVVLAVHDTGIGIEPERLADLFDPFTQADGSTTRRYGGTGLGLAICREFATLLGGTIDASSVPGEGSVFRLVLPVGARTSVARAPFPRGPLQEGRDEGVVLVIDDDPAARDLARRSLEPLGYEVHEAENGTEGLRLARELRPRVITLDVLMPDLDGFQLLAAIKADPELEGIAVVLVTLVDDRSQGFGLGAADYLVKPVDRSRLVSTVRRLARQASGTVLLVEDDAPTRDMVRRSLERDGWTVEEAVDGAEALAALARADLPDVVLLDLMMPEVDGFEVAAAMRSDPRLSQVPVVVLTAMELTPADLDRLRGRVENVLLKGVYGPSDLVREVRFAVRRFGQRTDLPPPERVVAPS